jgi:hypothetical protein
LVIAKVLENPFLEQLSRLEEVDHILFHHWRHYGVSDSLQNLYCRCDIAILEARHQHASGLLDLSIEGACAGANGDAKAFAFKLFQGIPKSVPIQAKHLAAATDSELAIESRERRSQNNVCMAELRGSESHHRVVLLHSR